MNITMVGTGYVGLVTGACFAEIGHAVTCVDTDISKIETLNKGIIPIYEPGLETIVQRNVANGRLKFSTDIEASAKGRDVVCICVGTPPHPETQAADLKYVFAAAEQIARGVDGFTVIATKSTVPVGTNRQVMEIVGKHLAQGARVAIASNPEFLREGAAIIDFLEPDRIVIGAQDQRAAEIMRQIYEPLTATGIPLLVTTLETAEVIKYAGNAFLAIKLSFINEVADLCEAVGADVRDVARGIGLDKRIGQHFLQVGPGWGGSCFPKDTMALQQTALDHGLPMQSVTAAIHANDTRKMAMARRVIRLLNGDVKGKKIAVLGLTFKGQTDDMRESPSLTILPLLAAAGAEIVAFDPARPATAPALLKNVVMASSPLAAAQGAEALVIMTEWREFLSYDYQEISRSMADPVVIDLRNLLDHKTVLASGFRAHYRLGIGKLESGV